MADATDALARIERKLDEVIEKLNRLPSIRNVNSSGSMHSTSPSSPRGILAVSAVHDSRLDRQRRMEQDTPDRIIWPF